MSWWLNQYKSKNDNFIFLINKLRIIYIDTLRLQDDYKLAKMEYNNEFQTDADLQKKFGKDIIVKKVPSEKEQSQEICIPGQEQPESEPEPKPEPPPNPENNRQPSDDINFNEADIIDTAPIELQQWIKKLYYIINLKYHPDKCQEQPKWFPEWLATYKQKDWLQFILFLSEMPEIIESNPPPEKEFKFWIDSYILSCSLTQAQISVDPVWVWKTKNENK